jgi:hypothetical protein
VLPFSLNTVAAYRGSPMIAAISPMCAALL